MTSTEQGAIEDYEMPKCMTFMAIPAAESEIIAETNSLEAAEASSA